MPTKKVILESRLKGAAKTKQGLKGIDGGLKSLGKSAIGVAGAYFGARGLISGFSAAIRLAGEQEQAEKKLEVALGRTSKSLLDHASSLQKVTSFGDEAIIGVQASLAAFLDSEEAIKKATEATLDISVAMGMDLKAAGDLVAKTLGSSTNAMSRYGIQVEGAVGSTERLESLTGNVAKLFGGQAKAQAETMTGALEQMKNALGDVAENIGFSLSPLVVKLAKGINSLATSTADESAEADSLFNVLKDVNATEEVRERAMQAINEQYGDYLPNLIDETFSLQDIEKAQDRVTGALLKRIALSVNEEKIADLMRTQLELRDKEPELINSVAEATKRSEAAATARLESEKKLGDQVIDFHSRMSEAKQIEIRDNAKLRLAENREEQIANQRALNQLNEDAVKLAEAFSDTILRMPERPLVIIPPEQLDILDDVIIDMKIMNDLMREAFNLRTDEEEEKEKQVQNDLKRAALSGQSAIQAMKSVVRAETMEAVAGYLSSVLKSVPFPANILLAAGGGGLVAGLMDKVLSAIPNQFATGADFITQGATPMLVGEAGPEHVQVTPLTAGMNQNGPQGEVTIQFNGPITNDDYVRDFIIPEISKATNQGLA